MFKRGLVWVRRDIRSQDHRAWSEAEKLCESLAVVFVFDQKILEKLPKADRRLSFIAESLKELGEKLEKRSSTLVLRYGDPLEEIPKVAKELSIDALFVNRDYEPYAISRDQKVQKLLEDSNVKFYSFKDHVIFEKEEVKNKSGGYFKVFTPYSKAWRERLTKESFLEANVSLKSLLPSKLLTPLNQGLNLKKAGFTETENFLKGGEKAAHSQLNEFQKSISNYKENRNYPALKNGTSFLSPYVRFGNISVRELCRATPGKSAGVETWHTELIWRDFYQMLLSAFPQLPDKCFQSQCDAIKWPGSQENFEKWCNGLTGYPIIDAAMRHFNKTGWMHNRLRMIVASFLTKDLLCHWKWGESYFAKTLLDFDLASNNGGWQWAASVGCDAQPYFRIFNPVTQSETYDAQGEFIRQELPELSELPNKYLHAPWTASSSQLKEWGVELGKTYPKPLVDHALQRDRAVELFKRA